jgi:glycosyltransferase involved in cell wall biosynthesis
VALLAPPWIPIPPPGYGGIELVIAELAGGLVRRGHDVVLLAAPGSESAAHVVPLLEHDHADEIGKTLHDVDHVGRALAVIDDAAARGRPFDILHDHSGYTLVAMADRVDVPVLHTVHGPFEDEPRAFYAQHADKVWISTLTRAQLADGPPGLRTVGAIPNPINVRAWPLEREKDDYLLWMARMTEGKGAHRAIAVARAAGRPLVLAGPVQSGQQEFFEREVQPHIDGERVRYLDEVAAGASRSSSRVLRRCSCRSAGRAVRHGDDRGDACGTPVIAFPEGSAPEVVGDGVSGFPRGRRGSDGGGGRPARRARSGALSRLGRRALRRGRRHPGLRGGPTAGWSRPKRSERVAGGPAPVPELALDHPVMPDQAVSVLDGNTFVVSDGHGDIEPGSRLPPHGFFAEDTRFVSHWHLTVAGPAHPTSSPRAHVTTSSRSSSWCRRRRRSRRPAPGHHPPAPPGRRLARGRRGRQPPR